MIMHLEMGNDIENVLFVFMNTCNIYLSIKQLSIQSYSPINLNRIADKSNNTSYEYMSAYIFIFHFNC